MTKLILRVSLIFGLFIFLTLQGSVNFKSIDLHESQQVITSQEIAKNLKISPDYGRIPLYFVPNEGQVDERALFYAKTSKYTLWLTKEGLIFDSARRIEKESTKSLRRNLRNKRNPEDFTYARDVSRMVFVDAHRSPEVIPMDGTEHKVNYLIGKDKSKWRTNVQTSRTVLYKELYPNIDLKVYGNEKQIEYDFIVKLGGDVSDIVVEYKDIESTKIDGEGNLVTVTKFGDLVQKKPVCYQVIEGKRIEVGAEFKKSEMNTYGFEVEEYNRDYELIIDPLILAYSTCLGGYSSDSGCGIAVDSEGATYITGGTRSNFFPTERPIQGIRAGYTDVFISKINPAGSALVYSTYWGTSWSDCGIAIAVDSEGAAYVTGCTSLGPYSYGYDPPSTIFVIKIDPFGALDYLYEWGDGEYYEEIGQGIAVDAEGAAYVTWTKSHIQYWSGEDADAFVTKINADGDNRIYTISLGGSGDDWSTGIAIDLKGAAYVTGETWSDDFPIKNPIQEKRPGKNDGFIVKINPEGTKFEYSTYLGGSDYDSGYGIAVDSEGAAYITGDTSSDDFPTENPIQGGHAGYYGDVFISKINPAGSALIYSTYLGGSDSDFGYAIAVDSEGAAYITGDTGSNDFPTENPLQGKIPGWDDVFITKIDPSGSVLIYSTYLGGSFIDRGNGIAVDSEGAAYITGYTDSDDFPNKNPIQPGNRGAGDVFITKLCTTFALSVAAGAHGTTDPPPGAYDYCAGSEAVIEAIPDSGYGFSHWSGDATGTDNPITIIMDSDKSIEANFIRQYTLTVTSGLGGTTDPSPATYLINKGTKVTLTGIPALHYRFSHWSGDIGGRTNPKIKTMNKDLSVTANFMRIIYPPSNVSGQKVLNRSLSQAEYINILSWQSNANNENIRNYRIYQVDGESRGLLVELGASVFEYWHRGVEETASYTYVIVAVNDEGREGDPAFVTVQ